ncbi:MAG: hypothetical protein NC416_01600 [Eubacterium sp.]|nr:hypothetical protein [Eubacterium sp.]
MDVFELVHENFLLNLLVEYGYSKVFSRLVSDIEGLTGSIYNCMYNTV